MPIQKIYQSLIHHRSIIVNFANLSFIQAANVLAQILLIPIIAHKAGLIEFGQIAVAGSYAAMVSILINYGSNQSGVKDVALHRYNQQQLSQTFYSIYYTRMILLAVSLLVLIGTYQWFPAQFNHLLSANTIILAEMLNPFFFFVGIQQLFLYNLTNLIAKIISALLIIYFITNSQDGIWVNFLIGITGVVANVFLIIHIIRKNALIHFRISYEELIKFFKTNFYLTGNNACVQLQQSYFLFMVSGLGDGIVLAAYSLIDKIIWSFRILIIAFFNTFFPRAAVQYQQSADAWKRMKRSLSYILSAVFLIIAAILFSFPDLIIRIITPERIPMAAVYLQYVALVPFIAALNSLNVADLLIKHQYKQIFIIAVVLLLLGIVLAQILIYLNQPHLFGLYLLIIECCSIPLYLYFIHKTNRLY
jgi:O-antigen/teichoic acid export membrane protein